MRETPLFSTPTAVMIEHLSRLGVKMNVAAGELLAEDGAIPRRVAFDDTKRSTLTKRFKQARPGVLTRADFGDFGRAAHRLLDIALSHTMSTIPRRAPGDERTEDAVLGELSGEASQAMHRALTNYGLDAGMYASALDTVMALPLPRNQQRAELALLLLLATGCLCDPAQALEACRDYGEVVLGIDLFGEAPDPATDGAAGEEPLCLVRVYESGRIGWRHMLSPLDGGTVIGSAPSVIGSQITDVDGSVSPRHLRVSYDGGAWWAQGMGSAAGTVVERADGSRETIEPSEERRDASWRPTPVRIVPADRLHLGSTTFFVCRFTPGA